VDERPQFVPRGRGGRPLALWSVVADIVRQRLTSAIKWVLLLVLLGWLTGESRPVAYLAAAEPPG